MTERLAIIDHAQHTLFIEDVDVYILESKYGGEEEEYIKDNYNFEDGYSWDWIIDAEYIAPDNEDPIQLQIDEWIKP